MAVGATPGTLSVHSLGQIGDVSGLGHIGPVTFVAVVLQDSQVYEYVLITGLVYEPLGNDVGPLDDLILICRILAGLVHDLCLGFDLSLGPKWVPLGPLP